MLFLETESTLFIIEFYPTFHQELESKAASEGGAGGGMETDTKKNREKDTQVT